MKRTQTHAALCFFAEREEVTVTLYKFIGDFAHRAVG
jgi:hypothetical protein